MNILTLIPKTNSYGVTTLAALSLGSFNIARHIYIRWLKGKSTFFAVNAMVKAIIVILGLLLIPVNILFSSNIENEVDSAMLGILFAVMTILAELKLLKYINRKKISNHTLLPKDNLINNVKINIRMTLSSDKTIHAKGIQNIRKNYSKYADIPQFVNYSLLSTSIVAIAEEFLFRGYPVIIASTTGNNLVTLMTIILSTLIFLFSHVSTFWYEFLYKLPLAITTMTVFLTTNSLLGAIIIHLSLNIYAYIIMKKTRKVAGQPYYIPIGVGL